MRADDWLIDYLIKLGCTDIFGIPGAVVMDFLYAANRRSPAITPRLNYNEQASAFAACGYAQISGKLGVAYSTRGPGFTNMITAIVDAYDDSVPVFFITAHSYKVLDTEMRVLNNQEIDTVSMVKNVTKYAKRIDSIEDFKVSIIQACSEAMTGRKGPVFLDILNSLFSQEVSPEIFANAITDEEIDNTREMIDVIENRIKSSHRPIILIGNGVRQTSCKNVLADVAYEYDIPILSSRSSQDIVAQSIRYYGFVGSRATRYSNFILSKADLIIAIGNRMAFPSDSASFSPVVNNANIIRIDIDDKEFRRTVPNCINYIADSKQVIEALKIADLKYKGATTWITVCDYLKRKLNGWDKNYIIETVMNLIGATSAETSFVCDVGNHSFWVTSAYAYSGVCNRIVYSASFGTLGSALPKAIGVYYATHAPVICFVGDQGVQFNIQELQFVSNLSLPIAIAIINNSSSGMIMDREIARYGNNLLHTTTNDGYSYPNYRKVAESYDLDYVIVEIDSNKDILKRLDFNRPCIIEIMADINTELAPSLPMGKACQDLYPELPRELYDELNQL